mmetsp:Transcript_15830/g.45707  ORF Transcript_15830/g.45707 Transcript_15830/m.45707 type:complete len:233 (+) Transcript_15830:892-1590(+)
METCVRLDLVVCVVRADDLSAIRLAELLEARRDLHRLAKAPELHLASTADVAAHDFARVQADANRQFRQPQRLELRVQHGDRVLLSQASGTCLHGMKVHGVRRVPKDDQTITLDLRHHTFVRFDHSRHHGEVPSQHEEEVALLERLGDPGEPLDVRVHDRHTLLRDVQLRCGLLSMNDVLHHGCGHEADEGLCATGKAPERFLQLPHISDPRSPSGVEFPELVRVMGEIEVA